MASVAAMVATRPLVSTRPSASLLRGVVAAMKNLEGMMVESSLADRRRLLFASARKHRNQIRVRPRQDLHCHDFADPTGGGTPGIDGGFHCRDVADDVGRDKTTADLLPAEQRDI